MLVSKNNFFANIRQPGLPMQHAWDFIFSYAKTSEGNSLFISMIVFSAEFCYQFIGEIKACLLGSGKVINAILYTYLPNICKAATA